MTVTVVSNPHSRLGVFFLAIRPRTLPASLSPVILGTSIVAPEHFNWLLAACALACALFLQIAVNLANDYFDAKSGVDTHTRLGPVRVTQARLASPNQVALGIAVFVGLATACGLVLVYHTGWVLLALGVVCILATLAYSGGPFPLASHGLGEVTVLLFFGWVAVMGSYYVHTQAINYQLFWLANALGLILAAIMLVNNLRDIGSDQAAGKKTLAVMLGDSGSRLLYVTMLMLGALCHMFAFTFVAREFSLILLCVPLLVCFPHAVICCRDVRTLQGRELNKLLASTALLGLVYSCSTAAFYLILQH